MTWECELRTRTTDGRAGGTALPATPPSSFGPLWPENRQSEQHILLCASLELLILDLALSESISVKFASLTVDYTRKFIVYWAG